MTGPAKPRGLGTRLVQVLGLVLLFAIAFAATHLAGDGAGAGTLAALGFLLLTGTLFAELAELVGLPRLTGYITAGVLGGPFVAQLVDHDTVEALSPVNTLALALIALGGGAELKLEMVKRDAKGLLLANLVQLIVALTLMTLIFWLVAPLVPFTRALTPSVLLGAALLWGTKSATRSPATTLAILNQSRARGPLSDFSLAFVMISDVLAVVVLAAVLAVARPLIEPGTPFSLAAFSDLGHELLGSISIGTTLGLLLAIYLKLSKKPLLLVLVVLGFGFSEAVRYLSFEPLLTFMVAGFAVQNLSRQGDRLLSEIEKLGALVYVLFFAVAGAHLDLPLLLELWPIALLLTGARTFTTILANAISARLAGAPVQVRRLGWAPMVSQAGLTIGFVAMIARSFPSFGEDFRSLAIATIAINQVLGPIVFQVALGRAQEIRPHDPEGTPA